MKYSAFLLFMFLGVYAFPQNTIDETKLKEDLEEILNDIATNYVYLEEKDVDLDCIRKHYTEKIPEVKSMGQAVLFFEYLLDEFYDSHLILNTNTNSSYRLKSPLYLKLENGKPIISNVWQTQIENTETDLIGAELIKINNIPIDQAIEQFPAHCNDKNAPQVREWILNKIVAGKYNEPRVLHLKLRDGSFSDLDLDKVKIKNNEGLLDVEMINDIGVIRINNSLGDEGLVKAFDLVLDSLKDSQGLIIDLRNTVDGGDTYVARGILGRFIDSPVPYQKHQFMELAYENPEENPKIERSWLEYVSPRGDQYKNPVVVLAGRWTGSMGEGLAIGFDATESAMIVGSEMERLAGEMSNFSFKNLDFGYQLSTAKLFHINGTPREKYVPQFYVNQTTTAKDECLEKGIQLIEQQLQINDSILKQELELIGIEDQTLRLMLPEAMNKFGHESEEYSYIWSLIHRQDSISLKKLINIIDNHGWLGKSRVGSTANQAIWLTLQHSELEIQEKYLPLLKESVAKGESEGWHLAYLQDRILMRKNQKQIYGTQALWDNDLKKNKIYPIEDLKNVNERRKKLGMDTVEASAEANGYIFDQKE